MTKRKITALFLASLIAVIATGCGQKSFLDNVEETTGTEVTTIETGRAVSEEELARIIENAPDRRYYDNNWYYGYCSIGNGDLNNPITVGPSKEEVGELHYSYGGYPMLWHLHFLAETGGWRGAGGKYDGCLEYDDRTYNNAEIILTSDAAFNGIYGTELIDGAEVFKFEGEYEDALFSIDDAPRATHQEWLQEHPLYKKGTTFSKTEEDRQPGQWTMQDYDNHVYFCETYIGLDNIYGLGTNISNANSKCAIGDHPRDFAGLVWDKYWNNEILAKTDFDEQFNEIARTYIDAKFMNISANDKDCTSEAYKLNFISSEELASYYASKGIKFDKVDINSIRIVDYSDIMLPLQVKYTAYTDSGTAYQGTDIVWMRYFVNYDEQYPDHGGNKITFTLEYACAEEWAQVGDKVLLPETYN